MEEEGKEVRGGNEQVEGRDEIMGGRTGCKAD